MPLKRERLRQIALAVAGATIGAMALQLLGAHGLLLANGLPVFGDFLAFWSAGRLALEGHAEEAYSIAAISTVQNGAFPGLNVVFPWRHAPMFLLFVAPLAALPFPAAALVFLALSGGLYLHAARKAAPDPRDLLFAAALPTALLHIGSVQTGLVLAGLAMLALIWLDRRPLAAGACIGLMAIKPHLGVLWPIMLAVQGRWRAFASATAVVLALTLVAGWLFGFGLLPHFIDAMREGLSAVERGLAPADTFASLYASLRGFGAPASLALTLHLISAAAATGIAIAIWRGKDAEASAAAFAAATLLVSPYLFFYDQTLLIIAVGALYRRASPREALWLAFAWIAGALSLAIGKVAPLPICPVAAWGCLMLAARRARVFPDATHHMRKAPDQPR
ncbi:MAG: DUF2029 domain-containing protein [Hyphomonadaceae bacterium]|nr:DUF2029 domain-containing protein [Hyphomonadaceae bacterium]